MKSGILKNMILYIRFGLITPSEACSKYPTALEPTTNKKKINRIPKVDLNTSVFKLFKRISFLYMP